MSADSSPAREGGCECGAARYRLSGEPLCVYACHCRGCQKSAGSAFTLSAIVPRPALELVAGELRAARVEKASGPVERHHCAACGGALWYASPAAPELVALKWGTLDDAGSLSPIAHVWTESAQPWVILGDARVYAQQPSFEELIALARERAEP